MNFDCPTYFLSSWWTGIVVQGIYNVLFWKFLRIYPGKCMHVSVLYICSEWAIAQKQCLEVVMESAINMLA